MNIDELYERFATLNEERAYIFKQIQATQHEWTIDNIVRKGDKETEFLDANALWPSQWRLPAEEIEEIHRHGIILNLLFSPTCVVPFPSPDAVGRAEVPFIFVDVTLMTNKDVPFLREELLAVILHEFGHRLNPVGRVDPEHSADDYSRNLGFASHLEHALDKLRRSGRAGFDTPGIQRRIERIKNSEPPFLCERLKR